jgi:toxin YoeB
MLIKFEQEAQKDFDHFYKRDKQKFKRIIQLIEDIQKNSCEGIGKPEKLKYNLEGCWSRRIDKANRLVYKMEKNTLRILACRYHYDK